MLTLNRPATRNAIDLELRDVPALADAEMIAAGPRWPWPGSRPC